MKKAIIETPIVANIFVKGAKNTPLDKADAVNIYGSLFYGLKVGWVFDALEQGLERFPMGAHLRIISNPPNVGKADEMECRFETTGKTHYIVDGHKDSCFPQLFTVKLSPREKAYSNPHKQKTGREAMTIGSDRFVAKIEANGGIFGLLLEHNPALSLWDLCSPEIHDSIADFCKEMCINCGWRIDYAEGICPLIVTMDFGTLTEFSTTSKNIQD